MPSLQDSTKVATDNDHSADKMLTKALLPSILGIVLCIILLCGTTFAWLTDSVYTGGSTLTAGNFAVSISVNNATVAGTQVELSGNQTYTVSISKSGSAESGYAILTIDNSQTSNPESYLIEMFSDEVSIITPNTGIFSVRVVPYWGTRKPDMTVLPEVINLTGTETTPDAENTPENAPEATQKPTPGNNIEDENGEK